jgi:polar amino acid transport system permease protein
VDPAGDERTGARLTSSPVNRGAERAAARRRRDRRGFAIAAASTVLVLGALVGLIVTSPGWDEIRDTFFSWSVFKESFPKVLDGFKLDVKLFLAVEVAVLIIGLLIAILRTTLGPALFPLRAIGAVYTDVLRGIPTILLVYLVGFGLPATELFDRGSLFLDPLFLGGLALTLSYSAYVAEVYRAGINSVHKGQREAALAVGLTETQAMRHVIIPQAIRRVGPPLLNDFIALQKDVALVSILGPQEAYRIAQIEQLSAFNYTPLIAAALLYLAVTLPLARLLDRWERGQGDSGIRSAARWAARWRPSW